MFSFWFHYNKPASLKKGSPMVSLHYHGACHLVEHLKIEGVRLVDRHRKTQPRFVIAGKARQITITNGTAEIR